MDELQRTSIAANGKIEWNDRHGVILKEEDITTANAATPPQEPRTTAPARDTELERLAAPALVRVHLVAQSASIL